jgi:uncharacterized protein YciU (UPF0263 family)
LAESGEPLNLLLLTVVFARRFDALLFPECDDWASRLLLDSNEALIPLGCSPSPYK